MTFIGLTNDFNPRSHEGSDGETLLNTVTPILISIHAPTRGATVGIMPLWGGVVNFNPRSHEGSDAARNTIICIYFTNFNPRSHEGSDGEGYTEVYDYVEFQSTLPRGERQFSEKARYRSATFQSTLPRGERLQH